MRRSNLIPITRIYDIYPKYTYSEGVKKFMDEIVDIDRANVYTEDEVIAMFTELKQEIDGEVRTIKWPDGIDERKIEIESVSKIIQQKIDKLKGNRNDN